MVIKKDLERKLFDLKEDIICVLIQSDRGTCNVTQLNYVKSSLLKLITLFWCVDSSNFLKDR